MWEIIKGNAFQVSSLCDNNETLIKCIWAPAREPFSSPAPAFGPFPAILPPSPPPTPLFSRELITAMLKLFSSQSKQTHLREASNSICALRGSLGSPINREPFHYTKRNDTYVLSASFVASERSNGPPISILRWKMRQFLFFPYHAAPSSILDGSLKVIERDITPAQLFSSSTP